MNLQTALASAVLELLAAESPRLDVEAWRPNVTELARIHVEVSKKDLLVSPDVDALILSTVNYAESRFRLPPGRGDCFLKHPLSGVPSGSWPKGYVPVMKRVCSAIGPMQIAEGNGRIVGHWEEIRALFPDQTLFTADDLEDPRTNIQLAYGILHHWKDTCSNKGAPASTASWLTAYRWGRCTPQHWNKRFFDREAKTRCQRLERMASSIRARGVELDMPEYSCTSPVTAEHAVSAS